MKNHLIVKLRGNRSQRQIAEELGVPVSTYAMVELGYRFPRRELQAKLAAFFKVTVDELFFDQKDHVS
ncbi:helix-turn-helix transcriptional regulator [Paenibacillus harenae]|uniref:helix-turn-helix transcriptional regulator n=1 Tax=Paenibacillus harenae TaxID=306543 RepID=UPI00048E41D7|nr:helix-turn-helix transcriptional regulator [Paenibacillus harenae]